MSRLNTANEKTTLDADNLLLIFDPDGSPIDKKMKPETFVKGFLQQNDIINGACQIWQEQVSFAAIADGAWHADMFGYEKSGAMVHTITRDTNTPANNIKYSIKADVTTADAAIAAGDYCVPIEHIIEGHNFIKYVDSYGTLSFWVSSPKTGTHCISFRNDGKDRSYIVEYTVAIADTWEYKQTTVLFDETGGTWDFNEGEGLRISWTNACGTTFQTTKDAWQVGNYFGTSSQVNVCDNVANNFFIAGIVFNLGKVPILDNTINFEIEMMRVQRYYEKSYNEGVYPGAATSVGALISEQASTGTFIKMQKALAAKKRVTPTVTWYSDNSGTKDRVYNNITGPGDVIIDHTSFEGQYSSGIPIADGNVADQDILSAHYVIDARFTL